MPRPNFGWITDPRCSERREFSGLISRKITRLIIAMELILVHNVFMFEGFFFLQLLGFSFLAKLCEHPD